MKNIIWVITIFSFLMSCEKTNKVEDVLKGSWSIDTVYYYNYNIKNCLNMNVITFNKNSLATIPTEDYCKMNVKGSDINSTNTRILFSSNDTIPFRINFDTQNRLFEGTHKIVFHKDKQNKLLKMEIFSDKLYLICRKGLFNYDNNLTLMNDLEKMTWTNRKIN